jgi:YkoY family integral membrane protein
MITPHDLFLVAFLAFLEGILSIDNALVLAMMARHLDRPLQKKALTYGLGGSIVFRLIALAVAKQLMQWHWVKLVGGGYLLYVALTHLFKSSKHPHDKDHKSMGFWQTVVMIEIMDIAFAVDSILAAVALTPKLWIVFAGGMLGVIMMRFAANAFLILLKNFPKFEKSAYLLVLTIGIKLIVEYFELPGIEFDSAHSPAFWVFWGMMATGIAYGFSGRRRQHPA